MKVKKPEKLNTINHISTDFCVAKGDTGATSHYWKQTDRHILKNIKKVNGPSVQLPNNTVISATEQGDLPLPREFSDNARKATILPDLKSANLISLGQLCDDNCTILLNKQQMIAVKNNKIILEGVRNRHDGLWDIPVPKHNITTQCCIQPNIHAVLHQKSKHEVKHDNKPPPTKSISTLLPPHLQNLGELASTIDLENAITHQLIHDNKFPPKPKANIILRKKETHMNLVRYLHAACFSPVPSTFKKAIKNGFLKSWPGLTTSLVDKHLPPSEATAKGHLRQERQHLQSTKRTPHDKHPIDDLCHKTKHLSLNNLSNACFTAEMDDFFPKSDSPNVKTNAVAYAIINHEDMSAAYTDLTGRFPQRSSRGNEYILVGYHYDANSILAAAIKDRTASTLTAAWQTLHKQFSTSGNAPQIYVLDNEKSRELTDTFNSNNVTYQLSPPHNHRSNMAERAIQTYKHHLKAGLATCDPTFPLSEWDRLIEQSVLTLNLLRASRTNPKLSAYSYIFGDFDFRSTPLAPPGIRVVAHLKPQQRGSWELNGANGFYVGPALSHYRCIRCYFPKSKSERVCDTVQFIPNVIPIPQTNIDDYLRQAAGDIVSILNKPPSTTYPSLQAGDPVRNALHELAIQLNRAQPLHCIDGGDAKSSDTPLTLNNGTKEPRVLDKTSPSPTTFIDAREPRVAKSLLPATLKQRSAPISGVQVGALEYTGASLPKNTRFRNQRQHRYPLRSLANHTSDPHNPFLFTNPTVSHIYSPEGKRMTMDALLNSKESRTWTRSLSNEWGRLASGNIYGVKGTKTIRFIRKGQVPKDRDVTYATFVCSIKPLKQETHRVRITVGGDRLSCPDDTGSPAANLLETKLLVNSTISDAKYGARFICTDIVNYFLASPMARTEYMKVKIKFLPQDIIEKYNLRELVTADGFVYIAIDKGMYGLRNAAILAYDNLKKNLEPHGYTPIAGTVGLWKHETRRTKFCVCVDDFGVKTYNNHDTTHLLNALQASYKITIDRTGSQYCGLQLDWNYERGYVDVSMPGYIRKALDRLQHKSTAYPQFSPHEHAPITYTKKGEQQFATSADTSTLLSPHDRQHLQSIVGILLYYGRALDYSVLPALNDIAKDQSKPTVKTMIKARRVLDYVATYPTAYLRFHASNMILHVDSDAAYLIAPKAKSRVAGFYYLSSAASPPHPPPLNAGILVECKMLRHVVASAAEAEIAGIFHNAQHTVLIRRILRALEHPQPPTRIKTDNTTANGFIHNNIHQKRSKSWDMRYYWLRDKLLQKNLIFFWEKGQSNYADYFTKHHTTKHHRMIRPIYIRDKNPSPTIVQPSNHVPIL